MKVSGQIAIGASLLVASASAQYQIDPNSVSKSLRQYWCTQQVAECPLICLDTPAASSQTESNACDPIDLTYSCVCSNGQSPNVTEYSQTLPFFICQEWGNQCASNCGTNTACISACRQNHPCGAQNPTNGKATPSSSSSLTGKGKNAHTSSYVSPTNPPEATVPAGVTPTSNAPAPMVTNSQGTAFSGFAGGSPASSTGGAAAAASSSAQTGAASSLVRGWALGYGQTFGSLALMGGLCGGVAFLL